MRLRRRRRADQADGEQEESRGTVQADLESLGVSSAFAGPVADRIAALRPELGDRTYAALLDGVTVAFDAHRADCRAFAERSRDLEEIDRLMTGFAGELRKLEEGLRIVSAYVTRMHSKADGDRDRLLH